METTLKRMILLGVLQVLLGCIVGLIPPPAVLHFRSIVTSHIEFCVNGMLLTLLGLITNYMTLSDTMMVIMEISAYLGTFLNGTAFFVSAFTGFGSPLAPNIHEKSPFPKGTEGGYSDLMTGMLMTCAVFVICSLIIASIGLMHHKSPNIINSKAIKKH